MSSQGLFKKIALLLAVLTLNVGQMWGADYYLISDDALNTTNFVAGGTFTKQSSGVTISGVKYAYYTTSGNQNTSSVSGASTQGKVLQYHCQTTATTLVISRYNSSSSSVSYYHNVIAEGATGDLADATAHTCTGYSNLNDTIVANGSTNRTIYIYLKSSNSSIKFLNVKAIESGTALSKAGEAGYSFNFDKGRLLAAKNADGGVPNEGLVFHLGNANYGCYNTASAMFTTSGTDYVKFSTGASAVTLSVTTGATAAYSVNKVKAYNADSAQTSPTSGKATDFTLDANSTYYINPNGTNIKLTKIQFSAASEPECEDVDAPTSLSCTAHTQTSLTFGWTKASNASGYVAKLWDNSSCTGDAVATENIANGNTETVTFSGLTAGTTYYCKVQSHGDGSTYCAAGGTTSAASGTTSACTAISPTWSYPFSTVAVGITIYPTIGGNTGGGDVTYSSSATSYITNACYATAAGSATITANVAAKGAYCSGSVTSGTITVVSDQSGLIKQSLTTGDNAWGTPSAPTTTDETNITSTTVLSATNLTISGNGNTSNGGQTAKITGMTADSEGDNSSKYMQMGFTVKSGKQLIVSAIYIPVQPVSSDANNFKAVLSDGETTITGTLTNSKNGKLAYIKFDSYGTVKGNVTLTLYAWGWTGGYRLGKSIVIDGEIEDAPSSCTAPSSVGITGTNKYLGGQTISLTATPVGGSGTATYQWQKEINSAWTNLENGGNISGATSANLQISSCGHGNSGQYRCVVSTGAACSTTSSAYGVHVFSVYGKYYSGEYSHNEIEWTSGTTGTATIHLNASSTYLFKIWSNDGYYYGNGENNYIIQPVNWNCGTGNHEMRLFTGPEGDYTFTVDIEHGLDGSPYVNVQVGYPSVTHPVTGYVYLTKWWSCYPHFWDGSSNALSPNGYDPLIATYTTICGTDYWYMPALDNYTNVYFKDNATWASATNHGDETSITGNSGKYYTHDGNSWGWHEFTTYTVSTAASTAGYGTVSAASVTGVACGTSISASTNTLTVGATSVTATATESTAQYTYAFDGWSWTPAGSTVTSDVTATANFTRTLNSYTVTWKNGATTLETDASVNYGATPSYDGSTPTKDADALYTYTFSGWSPAIGTVTGDATYSAQFTAIPKTVAYGDATIYAYNDSKRVVSGTRKTAMETTMAGSNGETTISGSLPLLHSIDGLTSVVLAGQCKSEVKTSFPWLGSYIKMKTDATTATITFNVASGYAGTATIYFSAYSSDKAATLTNGANSASITSDKKSVETEGNQTSKNIALVSGANTLTISGNNGYISRIDVALEASCTSVAAPTSLSCSAQTSSSLTFTWTKAANASGYTATLYSDAGCTSSVSSQNLGDVNTVTFSTLTASTTYYCKVQSKGDGSTYCAAGGTTSAQSGTTDADTPVGTTYYLVTSTAQLNTTDTYVIMDDGKAAMMGVYGSDAMTAITSGFTAAADKSTVTVTSSDVNTLTLQAESSAWNIVGKDDKKLTTNSTIGAKLFGNTPKATEDSKDDFVFSFADGKATIKRNTETNYHIYYSSGTGFNQSTSSTNIRLYTSNSTPVYTVTYNLNGGTGTVPTHRAEKSGTSITLASSTGLTKDGFTFDGWLCSANSTKYNAGASYTMTAVNTTFTAQWVEAAAPTLYTVTFNSNGGSSVSPATQASADASIAKPSDPTRASYEFDGWYTTAGEKISWPYTPEADITLYARWQEACDAEGVAKSTTDVAATGYTAYQEKGGSNVVFTSAPSLGFKYKDADGNTINNSTTAVVRNNAYKCQISSDSGNKGSIKTNSTFSNVDSISFYFAASDKGGCKIAVWCSTDNFSTDSTSLLSATTYASNNSEFKQKTLAIPSGKKASALTFKFRFTVTSSGKTSYIDSLKVYSSTTSGGTCYHVYYHGNGAESGYVNDTVSYTAGSKATVLNYNYGRYPLAKAGYDFRGWATSASGAVAYSAGQKIDITSADVDLYAVWAPASTALVTWTMGTNTSTWSATATSTTDGTNITSIGTARTNGSDGKREGATAKVSMAEKEVSSAAAPSNSANFTFTIGATKQVEINKFDCKVFNVASGNRTYKAQISDAAGNVYNSTNKVAVSAEATLTDASFVFGSGKILRGDVTIRIYAWGSGSEFRMGPDVKFYGTVDDYACATPAAPTISGVSEYVPGQTITLTASHDGENHDGLTTYTWYKGVDWATASGTTPVQAAATGESGYTLTIDDCTTGNAGKYWCKVSNGTGCDAHNSEGYDVTVYPTYTITYNLNGGAWGEVEHKDSYTQFDEDYTLPTPTKADAIFAGWYGTSDFSGLPTVVLGAGSVGNKEYYAKWGAVVTVSWTVTKVDGELYRGGSGYKVTAVIDQVAWDNSFKDGLELTATEGVTLKNIVKDEYTSGSDNGKTYVTADFDITTGLAADATEITFTLSVPADGTYGPKVDEHEETLTSCGGGIDTDNSYVIGKSNSDATNISSSAALRAYKTASDWYSKGNTTFTDKTSTDGFTISATEKSYYWQNNGTFTESSSSNCRLKTIKLAKSNGVTIRWTNDELSFSKVRFIGRNTSAGDATTFTVSNGTTEKTFTFEAGNSEIQTKEVTMDFVSGNTKGIVISGGTKEINILIELIPTSVSGVTPTLTWDDGDEDIATTGIAKNTSDNDFIYTARQNKNSLGAITYSSSDATVATVNATTGQVHLVGAAGTATITATIAASGCFSSANVSYTITVTDDCDDEAGTITTEDLGCSGIKMTVTGHTTTGETVSYQWYKVGTPSDAEVGENQDNFTATEAGSYYVIVTNTGDRHCAKRSTNTITVEAQAAATVTKIVDSWYVKNDRRTPDIELVKTTNATSFTVTSGSITIWESAGSTKTGFGGCGFHMDENGIIYLNGTKDDDGSATTGLTAGDETLTITAISCGGNASQNITIHKQAATDYKEIAFVVDGEKGKDFDQVTSGHAAGTELYTYLDSVGTAAGKRLFKLTQQNIYSTTDEKAIRQHYSQFDGILITDDPSTNTTPEGDYKTKGYVNAFGTMVDVRPIFTMEAYVSALKNWGSKGIAGNPQSPNPRQYEMRLECKDHEIYGAGLPDPEDGTNVWEEVIDGETFRHVILVDSTKGIYNGVAYNAETAGNKKPALQGFTGEAAGSLLGLGRILEGTLQAAIERQEEPAARLLVMGINAKALQPTCALTNEGKTVIKNILVYLLKTNMEEVDDCSNYFTGKIDDDWSKAGNWSKSALPSSEAKVRILAPCVISGIQPHVLQVSIVNSGNSNIRNTATGSAVCNGTLTIEPDGALIADGKIRSAVAPHFAANDLKPTTPEMLTINTRSDAQAALIFNNEEGLTKATVNLYSLGRKPSSYQYQYFAVPMEVVPVNPAFANETHGGTGIYTYVYSEASSGWTRRKYYDDLFAFEGLGITTKSTVAMNYTMTGTLASTATKEITLTHDGAGLNLIGNSWMAPIQIGALAEDNTDANITQTVYIYCAGRDIVEGAATSGVTETAGQWIAIPFEAAEFETWKAAGKLSVIPAMQAFQIKVADEATLTLDYDKVVRGSTNDLNAKLRAPRRRVAAKEVTMTNIRVSDSKTHTDLSLFEGDRFSEAFDNGWEAEYMNGDGRSAKLYAETEAGQMAVAAMYDYEGTVVGFAPGQETEYTFSFMGEDNGYYLNDIKLQNSVRISEGETYTFTYEEGDTENRFYISRTPLGNSDVPTGVDNVHEEAKPRKFIYNDKMYILYNGRVFDATGKVVK